MTIETRRFWLYFFLSIVLFSGAFWIVTQELPLLVLFGIGWTLTTLGLVIGQVWRRIGSKMLTIGIITGTVFLGWLVVWNPALGRFYHWVGGAAFWAAWACLHLCFGCAIMAGLRRAARPRFLHGLLVAAFSVAIVAIWVGVGSLLRSWGAPP
jgi:hypothetical protein